jgi:hypothetical protein
LTIRALIGPHFAPIVWVLLMFVALVAISTYLIRLGVFPHRQRKRVILHFTPSGAGWQPADRLLIGSSGRSPDSYGKSAISSLTLIEYPLELNNPGSLPAIIRARFFSQQTDR